MLTKIVGTVSIVYRESWTHCYVGSRAAITVKGSLSLSTTTIKPLPVVNTDIIPFCLDKLSNHTACKQINLFNRLCTDPHVKLSKCTVCYGQR